jgi:hypothetical protein
MPKKERFTSAKFDWADLLVLWPQQDELTDHYIDGVHIAAAVPYVQLAPTATEKHKGGISFRPDTPEDIGLKPGESVGPVGIRLDRAQVNQLITTLRQARDEAFGADA